MSMPASGGGARRVTDRAALGELSPGGSVGISPGNEPPRWQPSENLWAEAWSLGANTYATPAAGGTAPDTDDMADETHPSYPESGDDSWTSARGVPPQNSSDLQGPGAGMWPSGGNNPQPPVTSMGGMNGVPPSSSALMESDMEKRDIGQADRERLAREGKALRNPDGHISYPIETVEDLHNAAHLASTGHGDVEGAKRLIARRSKELGVANPLVNSEKLMQSWATQSTGTGDGTQNSPARHPLLGQFMEQRQQLAQGHIASSTMADGTDRFDPARIDQHLNYQPSPFVQPLANLATVSPPEGAIASSIACHQGMARVASMPAAAAASPFLMNQLSQPPSGRPVQPAPHQAQPTMTPMRPGGAAYCDVPGAMGMKSAAPGSQFTTRIPGNRD